MVVMKRYRIYSPFNKNAISYATAADGKPLTGIIYYIIRRNYVLDIRAYQDRFPIQHVPIRVL